MIILGIFSGLVEWWDFFLFSIGQAFRENIIGVLVGVLIGISTNEKKQ
jgi:hypothetical protein